MSIIKRNAFENLIRIPKMVMMVGFPKLSKVHVKRTSIPELRIVVWVIQCVMCNIDDQDTFPTESHAHVRWLVRSFVFDFAFKNIGFLLTFWKALGAWIDWGAIFYHLL